MFSAVFQAALLRNYSAEFGDIVIIVVLGIIAQQMVCGVVERWRGE